jgi:hypothetical protein
MKEKIGCFRIDLIRNKFVFLFSIVQGETMTSTPTDSIQCSIINFYYHYFAINARDCN